MSAEARITTLELAMAELAAAQARTTANIDRLIDENARRDERLAQVGENIGRLIARDRLREERWDADHQRRDERLAQVGAHVDRTSVHVDRLSVEMSEFKAELRASSRAADKRWGELANKLGTLAEDLVAPGIPTVFGTFFGLPDPEWRVRVWARHRTDRSRRREYDVVAWDGDVFLVNETKSQARADDVPALLEAVSEARGYFAEAQGRRVFGSIASFLIDPSVVRAAEREGLLVFGLGTGLLEVLNSPGFKPREF